MVTLDNHYLRAGGARWWRRRSPPRSRAGGSRLPIGSAALPECGTNDEVLAYHRLDVAGLLSRLRNGLAPRSPMMTVLFWDMTARC